MEFVDTFILDKNKKKKKQIKVDLRTAPAVQLTMNRIPDDKMQSLQKQIIKMEEPQKPNTNKSEYAFNTAKDYNNNYFKGNLSLKVLALGQINNMVSLERNTAKYNKIIQLILPFHESEQQSGIVEIVVAYDEPMMITFDENEQDENARRHENVKNNVKNTVNNEKCDLIDYLKNSNLKKISSFTTPTTNRCKVDQNNDISTSTYVKFDDLVAMQRNEKRVMEKRRPLRLCGGGEGSLTNAQTGWGSPPNPAVGGTAAGSWGAANAPSQWGAAGNQTAAAAVAGSAVVRANSQQPGDATQKNAAVAAPPQGQSNSGPPQQQAAQAPPNPAPNSAPAGAAPGGGVAPASAPTSAAKNQLEQLNTMREALFSQDGWGCQNVNQETNWDVPGSPEPLKNEATGGGGSGSWKTPNMNNGTDLWEANLRNGGPMPAPPVPKTQWNPKTPYGGTWGDDDDNDGSQVWGGVAATGASGATPTTPGWNQAAPGASGAPAWPSNSAPGAGNPNVSKIGAENEWSGAGNGVAPWTAGPPAPDPRLMQRHEMGRGITGDSKGISGRLAPPSLEGWNTGMPGGGPQQGLNSMIGQQANANGQWPATGPKEMPVNKPAGWVGEGTSPPRPNRQIGFDDGTSLWQNPPSRIPGNTPWKEMPDSQRNNLPGGRPGAPAGVNPSGGNVQSRLGPAGPGGIKPDAGMWGGNRGAWEEHAPGWEDKIPGGPGWNDSGMNSWNKAKPTPLSSQSWNDGGLDGGNDWGQNKGPNRMSSNDMIRSSKIRTLCDLGIKKEEAEWALRNTPNFEEALELLRSGMGGAGDQWRRSDDHSSGMDQHSSVQGRFPGGPQPSLPFPPNTLMGNLPNSGSSIPGANPGGPLNKLPQVPPNYVPPGGNNPLAGGTNPGHQGPPGGQSSQPSTQQLRMLVQQIQMAVQAGYLNHQILNQPLAPQTLILLNQLLTCIKQLQQLQPNNIRNQGINPVQANMITSKIQQQIKTLQSQITAQQQIYMKQASTTPSTNDYLRSPTADPLQTITNAFPELNIGKSDPGYNTQSSMSRLETAWKVQKENDSTDFSRAPGTTTKSTLSNAGNNTLNLNNDGPWSSNTSARDGWPDSSGDNEKNDWPSQNSPAAFTDLVPEFKPGEPWKGTQQKSIEDDPSITPGSVARSPLSIAADKSDIFSTTSKTSPTDIQSLNISSSTWSFTPSGQQNFSGAKAGGNANTWSDTTPPIPKSMASTPADLWSAGKRGPPPGLGTQKSTSGATNWQSGSGGWSASSSSWLLLKNLTAQIDGSTLRTLCIQHGPLQNFHLYLNHGIALCKYGSREEANKAQPALNNCVLGNTTIFAESPSDGEVQSILQQLGAPNSGGGSGNGPSSGNGNGNNLMSAGQSWRPPSQQGPTRASSGSDAWGSSWPTGSSSGNLWTPIDGVGATERGTPSNLNSFLPENLLGGELN